MSIRAARCDEAEALTELAMRSKAHWGYSAEFMDACRDELAVDAAGIGDDDYLCCVAERDGRILGFYTLTPDDDGAFEVAALFVEPDCIGKGIGRMLLEHARASMAERGIGALTIQSDPYATGFYLAAGAVQVGERPSGSVPGRVLPLLRLDIDTRPSEARAQ